MKFIKYLHKDKWIIRVYENDKGYLLEFSNNSFQTKQRKEFSSREELLEVLSVRFSDEELEGI